MEVVAGTGDLGFTGDGGPATEANIGSVESLLSTRSRVVYLGDVTYNRIRRFTIGGNIETIAGNGFSDYCGDIGTADGLGVDEPDEGWDYSATNAAIDGPAYLAVLADGRVVWTEEGNHLVRVRYPDDHPDHAGEIATLLGNGCATGDEACASWAPGTAELSSPSGVAACDEGGDEHLFVADTGNNRLRRIDVTTGEVEDLVTGLAGPTGLATRMVGGECYIYVTETDADRISVVDGGGSRRTYVGAGPVAFDHPLGLAIDDEGNLYVADSGNDVVMQVRHTGNPLLAGAVTDYAGNRDTSSYVGDGDDPLLAGLSNPQDVAFDTLSGSLFIVDMGHNVIRVVREEGGRAVIRTAVGDGACEFEGDYSPAMFSSLCSPTGIAVDGAGGLYIADSSNNRIRHAYFEGTR